MSGVNWNLRNWILRNSSRSLHKRGLDPAGAHPQGKNSSAQGPENPWGAAGGGAAAVFLALGDGRRPGPVPVFTAILLECPRIQVLRFQLDPDMKCVPSNFDQSSIKIWSRLHVSASFFEEKPILAAKMSQNAR